MVVDFNLLWNRARSAATSDEAESVRIMADILSSKEGRRFITSLELPEAELCIEILDYGLAEHNLRASQKQAFFVTLRRLAGRHGQLPESMVITDEINPPVYHQSLVTDGFTDIRRGRYEDRTVLVKIMRVSVGGDFEKIKKQFCKDVILQSLLPHPNVLKLVGVLAGMEQGRFAAVLDWMARGNILDYISKNPANRLELLRDAAQGLRFLHNAGIAHGALNVTNVLITDDAPPKACLVELRFKATALVPSHPQAPAVHPFHRGGMVFTAPELIVPSKYGLTSADPTNEADIYAFGMVILQVLTGEPLRRIIPEDLVLNAIRGVRPSKPTNAEAIGISEPLWELIRRCWGDDRTRRPQIREVVAKVGDAAANWHTDMPPGYAQPEIANVVDELDEPERVEEFETCQADEIPFPDPSTDTSEPGDVSPVPIRPGGVQEPTCLDFNPLPSISYLPRKRRRFGRFLTGFLGILWSKPKH